MKPLISLLVCLAIQLLPASSPVMAAQSERPAPAAESDIHAALLALERQRSNAILRRDIVTLRTLMDHYQCD